MMGGAAALAAPGIVRAAPSGKPVRVGGTLSLTGFDDTSGHWTFSTQSTGGTVEFTWSSSTVAVPEPATLALIGAGLASAGLLRRRKTA
jgi:hypothetical protein